jgi:hypothetical protein
MFNEPKEAGADVCPQHRRRHTLANYHYGSDLAGVMARTSLPLTHRVARHSMAMNER